MAKFPYGNRSKELLSHVHPKLRNIFTIASDVMDIAILPSTVRTLEQQIQFFNSNKSQTMDSLHLVQDDGWGHAVDAAPYPVNWNLSDLENVKRWYHFIGVIKAIAITEGVKIRCGGDWDMDNQFNDQKFHDLPHIELKG